jgi:hypothetical protein
MTFSGHLTDAQAQRLLEGALEPGHDDGVRTHVECCPHCCDLVDSYRALSESLDGLDRVLAPPPLPDDFTAGVLCCIEERERAAARERTVALGVVAAAVVAAASAFALAGASAWAPVVSRWIDAAGDLARAWHVGAGFVPSLLSALRLHIIIAASVLALPLLLALSRLVPAPRTQTT